MGDVMTKYQKYEILKRKWIKDNPNATYQEYEKAIFEIAKICGV